MEKLTHSYRLLNILSVDVALGAVTGALFFANVFSVSVLPYGLISLGLTVWIIYTADHLIDARKVKQPASSERHRFHQKYFKLLLVALMIGIIVDATQLFFIRKIVFIEGVRLAITIVIYFLIQRSLKFFKEITGAILYSGGVLLIPLSTKTDALTQFQIILIIQFVLTALINLLLFSLFDKKIDEQDRQSSYATVMGERTTKISLIILFLIQIVLTAKLLFLGIEKSVFIFLAMNIVLLFIFLRKEYFQIGDRYRLLGDAVFLLPIIQILI